jgi:hypothetical protein
MDMDAPQYVHGDVPSDDYGAWMFSYTHHIDIYVPQHVSPHPLPKHPVLYMFLSMFPITKKKGSNITVLKIENILKLCFKSVTQVLCHKKCVLYQIPLNITHVIYYSISTIYESNTTFTVTSH